MAIVFTDNGFCINDVFSMNFSDVPVAVEAHLRQCPDTVNIEHLAEQFVNQDFPLDHVLGIVESICRWGGRLGPLVFARVMNNNTQDEIQNHLRLAYNIESNRAALQEMCRINWLSISFGSKYLRMMSPKMRVVLDRVLSVQLNYPLNIEGYDEICSDCIKISNQLTQLNLVNPLDQACQGHNIANPRGNATTWWPADVETALFAKSQGWTRNNVSTLHKPVDGVALNNFCDVPVANDLFEGFWFWLQTPRTAPTLSRRSSVSGCADGLNLEITTSNGIKISPIRKVTVKKYCDEAQRRDFKGLVANQRWVAAMFLFYCSLDR